MPSKLENIPSGLKVMDCKLNNFDNNLRKCLMSSVQVHILLVHVRQKGNDDNDDKFRENAILKN